MVNRDGSRTPLEKHTKELFDESVQQVDGRTRSALTQARYAATEEIKAPSGWFSARIWAPLTGVAAAAIVAVLMLRPATNDQATGEASTMAFEDFDLVADADNLDMLEDLDFYAWLDTADALPSG